MSNLEKTVSPLNIKLNHFLVASLVAAGLYYAASLSILGTALALTSVALAVAVHRHIRLGYFACSAACFGAFWLARTGQEFIGDKHLVMGLSLPFMVFALYLHEQIVPKGPAGDDHVL